MSIPGDEKLPEAAVRARIDRAVGRARLSLLWESIWPVAAPFLGLGALFLVVSWFGLWRLTSTPVRVVLLAIFAAAFLWLVWRIRHVVMPDRLAGLARVEQATGVPHHPATALGDPLATKTDDAVGQALWAAHRRRALASLGTLRAGTPAPRLDRRDPLALRFLAALLIVVGFVFAGSERWERVGEAFRGGESVAQTVARIDAWVTPPAYTGRPPIFLTGDAAKPAGTEYSVPAGSVVTVRTGGARDLDVVQAGAGGEMPIVPVAVAAQATPNGVGEAPLEHQVALTAATDIVVRRGDRDISAWRFAVEPDSPPEIALTADPMVAASGALQLTYSLKDDYGVVGALAEFAPAGETATDAADMRPLFDAPQMPLSLPQLRTRSGNGETTRDLTSHPWAGATVTMTLVAEDEAGQQGRTEPREITLPQRRFFNPLAKAVVEQRARLALDANAELGVIEAFDALTMAPAETMPDAGTYLALRSIYNRVVNARGDDDLRATVDYMWTVALGIEDGDLSLSAQRLRAAQEALREALENDASDEEIARLTEELRQALQEFMQALAEQAQRNPQTTMPQSPNTQMLRPQDLDRMLDQIEELSRTGSRDAARQLLSQLQNMLENLQAGRPQMGDPQQNQMMESLNQLGEMIQRQEQLMNETFRAQRGQNPDGSGEPMTEEQLAEALRQLQQQQEGLAQQLQEMMQGMEGMGMEPNGKLGQAGEAMGRAGSELGEGNPGSAVGEQSTALDALRQGAQGLAQQLAEQQGQQGPGGIGPGYGNGDANAFPNEDPLGRPQRNAGPDLGTTVKVPDEIDTQRAREILDAIRKRLGESFRPELERDYLERLLERF